MSGGRLRSFRALLRQRALRIAGMLARLAEEEKLAGVRASLAHCAESAVLRGPLHIEGPGAVAIGEGVSLNPFIHMWGQGGIEIGARTMIASHVAIISVTHDPDSPHMHDSVLMGRVRIGNDVWIGAHAVILPGVTIGAHAVVAAGAVVRADVPACAVVAGVPAEIVRLKRPDAGCAAPVPGLRKTAVAE